MQILLGHQATIVKINSDTIKIDYIQHFIATHFPEVSVRGNTIFLPESTQNSYHRTFLLKWIYTLYTKKTHLKNPALKQSLVHRQQKAIRIELKEKILYTILYKIVDTETINIKITPANSQIALQIKTFLQTKIILLPTSLQVKVPSQEEKNLLQQLLSSQDIITMPHTHLYNKKEFYDFFNPITEEEYNPLEEAYKIFDLTPQDSSKTIKKRYKTLAKQYHPDMNTDANNTQEYTHKFQMLLSAYNLLVNKI